MNSHQTDWYLIHTKPRQESRALFNLENQGYHCYCPMMHLEKLRRGKLSLAKEAMFSRYLFIRLDTSRHGQGWSSLRSTLGVSALVSFGGEPSKVDPQIIDWLRQNEQQFNEQPERLFSADEHVMINQGPFSGLEAIYETPSGPERALVLIEILGKATRLKVMTASLKKIN